MKIIKYLILLSTLSILSSCAKEEELSMGTLAVETKITNISPYCVMINMNIPNNSVLEFEDVYNTDYYLRLYKNSEPVYNDDFGYEYLIEERGVCIIGNLEPNTTYTYQIECTIDYGEREITISDPSYTFTTQTEQEGAKNMTVEYNSPDKAILKIELGELSKILTDNDFDVCISKDKTGDNERQYAHPIGNSLYVAENLEPETTYYVFFETNHWGIRGILNSFTTTSIGTITGELAKASMSTLFLAQDRAVVRINYNKELACSGKRSYDYAYGCIISTDPDRTEVLDNVYPRIINSNQGYVDILIEGFNPSTNYYLFYGDDFYYQGSDNKLGYIQLNITPNSFTTAEEGNYGVPLDATSTVSYDSWKTIIRIDFDKHLTLLSSGYDNQCSILLNGTRYAHYGYNYTETLGNGYILFEIPDLKPSTQYKIEEVSIDRLYYIPDSGDFSFAINSNPLIIRPKPDTFTTPADL